MCPDSFALIKNPEEPPKIASDGVEVRFEVEKKTNHGEEVFVCGGRWA